MTRLFNAMRLGLALLFALALPIRTASAHPRLLRAAPAPESRLSITPREITLTFHEAVSVGLCRLTLLDAARQTVTLDSLRVAPGDARTLTTKIHGMLRPGRYTVKWQAGGADGHPVRGEYNFVVEADPVRPAKRSVPPVQGGAATPLADAGMSARFRSTRR
ncbi:MAG: copper resistance CopC family protein [Gemmatimonadaceae bacterium]